MGEIDPLGVDTGGPESTGSERKENEAGIPGSGFPLADFHENFTLEGKEAARQASQGVALMTIHGSKGLEFERVYLPWFMVGLAPHQNALAEGPTGLEEERRLAYVAFTRAKKELVIAYPSDGAVWAPKVRMENTASPFIVEADGVDAEGRPLMVHEQSAGAIEAKRRGKTHGYGRRSDGPGRGSRAARSGSGAANRMGDGMADAIRRLTTRTRASTPGSP